LLPGEGVRPLKELVAALERARRAYRALTQLIA
jgi:hypothetical protein